MKDIRVKDVTEAVGGKLLCGDPETPLTTITLDSRNMKGGDLFVPLIGEKVDAHRFLEQAFANGAAAAFTSEHDEMDSDKAYIRVEDTKKALQDLGRYLRSRLTLPLIGVTGSVGKTTTRELIAAALSAHYRVYRTPGNSNSQVGVPITISEISKEDEVGVIELGMSEPGELTIIAKIAQISMAVITNVGITHIEQLGSRENIYREKLSIQDGLRDDGILILNGDDDMLCRTKGKEGVTTLYYGTGENADYRAEDIVLKENGSEFTAVCKEGKQRITLRVPGRHNILNAMAAIAVCMNLGMTLEEASRGLYTFTGFKNRQNIFEGRHYTILDDSYNASPASMMAAADVFMEMKKGHRHVAVLADMRELGPDSPRYHEEVGEYIGRKGPDLIITLGTDCHKLADGVRKVSEIPVKEFEDRDEMTEYIMKELKDGDCILFKGSNSLRLFDISAKIMENN